MKPQSFSLGPFYFTAFLTYFNIYVRYCGKFAFQKSVCRFLFRSLIRRGSFQVGRNLERNQSQKGTDPILNYIGYNKSSLLTPHCYCVIIRLSYVNISTNNSSKEIKMNKLQSHAGSDGQEQPKDHQGTTGLSWTESCTIVTVYSQSCVELKGCNPRKKVLLQIWPLLFQLKFSVHHKHKGKSLLEKSCD